MTTVFIISAPSGSGKSTLVNELRKIVEGLDFSVSYTTRPPRGSEQNRKEYYFVPRPEFEAMVARDEFLEHADVFGNYYGTHRRFLEEAQRTGHDLLLDIDVQGATQIQKKIPDAVSIFVLPPNHASLEWRLRSRGLDAEEVILRRLDTARREIENYDKYDYILVNDRLEESVDVLRAIVLSERLRRSGRPLTGQDQAKLAVAERCRLKNIRERIQPILDSFRDARGQGQS
ncbi:MAG TPA: guanylate kinase [Terriglobales bacterium]|nr:guanylate kinase [Terriglobales bacterium]